MKKKLLFPAVLLLSAFYAKAQVTIYEAVGWLESAFVKWAPITNANSYNVYYTGGGVVNQKIDNQLIRGYGAYFRADVLGLAAGSYTLKVVPVIGGSENTALATTTQSVTVKPHVREGFAFSGNIVPGAYNANGTPQSGAKIIYITASTVNTVICDVTNDKGVAVTATGLTNILTARGKGYDKTPLIVRMTGLIKGSQINGLKDGNYISFTGSNNTTRKLENITFEGIGDDATAHGYGFYTKRCNSIEIRNVGIMLYGDDAISLETDNSNIWIHNGDFFYGAPGSDADQVKGDGTIDMKYNSSNITISYNHFWESGKTMGCGGSTETVPTFYVSFHHNWFDHVDSRNPRLHYATAHVYNNYYDGVAKYGIGNTTETSVFVEANYFRNCKHPMMISGEGTDTYNPATGTYTAEGTFSGQDGGMTKAFNNKVENANRLVYQTENATQFDAYAVTTRNAQVPGTVKSLRGGFAYTNFDISPTMYISNPHSPDEVQSVVTTYAGRVKGGDFKWTFNNSVDDASSDINAPLKAAIVGYTTRLVFVQGEGTTNTPVTGVSVSPTSLNLLVGGTAQLTATVAPSNATNQSVSWNSNNTAAATVNASGLITALAPGSATITVTTVDGNKTATCTVTITSGTVSNIYQGEDASIITGVKETKNSGYTGTGYANADNNAGAYVEWTVNAGTAGTYSLEFRYAVGTTNDRAAALAVNSTTTGNISFPGTGAWTTWKTTTPVNVNLIAGINKIRVTGTTSDGPANLDYLKVTGSGTLARYVTTAADATKPTNARSVSVFPNPAKSYTKLQFTLDKASLVTVDIYNVTGMKVKSGVNRSFGTGMNTMNIDIANLKPGIYLVTITIDSQTICSPLIIK
jgi:pectate lyase